MKIPYTLSEKNERRYTVKQAVDTASMLLKGTPVCLNALRSSSHLAYDMSDKITLERLNKLVDQMVDDSRFYSYHNY